jgi:hypothetical protein
MGVRVCKPKKSAAIVVFERSLKDEEAEMPVSDGQLVARYVIWACALGTSIGASWGLAESIADYPASSWPAVTTYVAILCAMAATILGLVAVGCVLLVRALRR